MEKYINQRTYFIPLKKKELNFNSNDTNISYEFDFLVKNIDNDIEHINTLNKGDSEKDRY